MKQTLLIITALMLVVVCSKTEGQQSTNITVSDVIEYHNDEVIPKIIRVYDISIDNIVSSYKEIKFYSNGQKRVEIDYKDGKQNGLVTEWFENGQTSVEGTFKDGELDGKWTAWYENGQKEYESTYKDGELDGVWTQWYENGQKEYERTYKDGEQIGETKRYESINTDGDDIVDEDEPRHKEY